MSECSQKSVSDSVRIFVVGSKVYHVKPDTSCRNDSVSEEEMEYEVAVQESDATVSLRKDTSEMAVLKR